MLHRWKSLLSDRVGGLITKLLSVLSAYGFKVLLWFLILLHLLTFCYIIALLNACSSTLCTVLDLFEIW